MKMKKIYTSLSLMIALLMLGGCVVSEEDLMERPTSETNIRFLMTTSSRAGTTQTIGSRRFSPTVLLLLNRTGNMQYEHFNSTTAGKTSYQYRVEVAGHVDDYANQLYDTGYPYLIKEEGDGGDLNTLYAVGFSPGSLLIPSQVSDGLDYRTLTVDWNSITDAKNYEGRIDFLSLDANTNFKGSRDVKFNNTTSQLVFRHLTSKIRVVAIRSEDMFNTQYVRDVKVTNLRLLYKETTDTTPPAANDTRWKKFCAPTQLVWTEGAGDNGVYGYKRTAMRELPDNFTLSITTTTPVTIGRELPIDSMYVCHHFDEQHNDILAPGGIYVKMNVSALISHLSTFPLSDAGENGLTYTRRWTDLIVPLLETDGRTKVTSLAEGKEYTLRLNFKRNGLYLDGIEEEWHDGGTHDIIITPTPTNN